MKREVDVLSHLPKFIQKYQEPTAALEAENPEFTLIWEAAERILYNHYISTADEYGIGRFEKMLEIYPTAEETLESRRSRVQSRWNSTLPYTIRKLIERLQAICEDTDFMLQNDFEDGYTLALNTSLEGFGKVNQIEEVIATMAPCNIRVVGKNEIDLTAKGQGYFTGVVSFSEIITILDERRE